MYKIKHGRTSPLLMIVLSFLSLTSLFFVYKMISLILTASVYTSSFASLEIFSMLFGILLLIIFSYPVFDFFKKYKNYVIVDQSAVNLRLQNNMFIFKWDDISSIGFQAVVSKKNLGTRIATVYLVLNFKDKKNLLLTENLCLSDFVLGKNYLSSYLKQMDVYHLYISLQSVEDDDSRLLNLLSEKLAFVKKIPPIVDTDSVEEYNRVVKEVFEA